LLRISSDKGIQVTVEDILSEEPRKRFDTLGTILRAMKQPMGFKSSFQEQLDNFVKSRNTFIHDYWIKHKIHSIDESIDGVTFQEIGFFELALYKETIYDPGVFRLTIFNRRSIGISGGEDK